MLERMMCNFEVWKSNIKNELTNRDCIDVIKYQLDKYDKPGVGVIANKNVAMFTKKTVDKHLLHIIEVASSYENYKDLVKTAPEKNIIMKTVLAEAPEKCSVEIESYILSHQSIHSRLMKANHQGTSEASAHPAHMSSC